MENSMEFLWEVKIDLPYNPVIPLLPGTYPAKSKIRKGPCTPTFAAALLPAAQTWEHPNVHQQKNEWRRRGASLNGTLLSRQRGGNNAICSNRDGPRDCHPEWSKTEKEKYEIAYPLLLLLLLSRFSCARLRDPIDGSPPGSPIPGILQARTLQWVVISFSNAWKWSRSVVSDPQRPHGLQPSRLLYPWDFPKQEHWSGVPLPSPNLYLITHQIFLVLHIFYWIFVCPCLQVLLKP